MGRIRLLCFVALVGLAFGGLTLPTRAICAGPYVMGGDNLEADFEETVVSEGRGTIVGAGFVDGCNDTGGGSLGGCSHEADEEVPYESIELTIKGPLGRKAFRGDLRSLDLGTIDVESDGTFTHAFDVPKLPAGLYKVVSEEDGRVGTVQVVKVLE